MRFKQYPEEFKIEAVKQATEKGYSVAEVAARLGTTTHSLYAWIKRIIHSNPRQQNVVSQVKISRIKKRVAKGHRRKRHIRVKALP